MVFAYEERPQQGNGQGELRLPLLAGVASELLLVGGMACLALALTKISRGGSLSDCQACVFYNIYTSPFIHWDFFQLFYLGIALLAVSLVGFAITLWLLRNSATTPSGTPEGASE
jgi:hypothetical protein